MQQYKDKTLEIEIKRFDSISHRQVEIYQILEERKKNDAWRSSENTVTAAAKVVHFCRSGRRRFPVHNRQNQLTANKTRKPTWGFLFPSL